MAAAWEGDSTGAGAAVPRELPGLQNVEGRMPNASRNLATMYLFSKWGYAASLVAMNPSGRHCFNCCWVRRRMVQLLVPAQTGQDMLLRMNAVL